jgi:serine/threonine protein kinase
LRDSPVVTRREFGPALRKRLAEHLLTNTGDPSFTLTALEALGLKPGAVVGPYRLIREIGCGGSSSVWLAERCDGQLKREVALKLPFIGPRTQAAGFMNERDILAGLTHPQIARLYDAGISDSGQPYLAMEYVEGTALLQSCDERRLTIRERLSVFLQVLEAVQFAHAQLVIHRDLKPTNIIVTPQGRAMLLDFGIGKLLSANPTQTKAFTTLFGRALTPDYASPEQIAGQSLGTASDIYSLGVILYELLTGARPYRLKRESQAALEEAILHDDARLPNRADLTAAAAEARGLTIRSLPRVLEGDLGAIVLKALKKNPHERYASVSAFAQDIVNFCQGLPISARPDSYRYRVARFWWRNQTPIIIASVVTVAVFSAAAMALYQARIARVERDRALAFASRNQAVTEFLDTIIREAAESPRPVTVSEMLTHSEELALRDTSDIPENRAAVLEMLAAQYFASGDSKHAAELTQRALTLLRRSPDRAFHSRLVCRLALARSELGHSVEGVATIQSELRNLNSDPETASSCLFNLAEIAWTTRTPAEALSYAKEGLKRYQSSPRTNNGITEELLLEAVAYTSHLNGRNDEANRYFERALSKYRETGRERRPPALTMMGTWAVVIDNAGMPLRALQLYEELSRVAEQREAGAEPPRTVVANRARTLAAVGRYAEARTLYTQACRQAEQQDDAMGRLQCVLGLASLAVQTDALSEAGDLLKRADPLLEGLAPESPPMIFRTVLEGRLDLATGRLDEARKLFDRALATKVVSPTIFFAQLGQAEIDLARGDSAAALTAAQSALRLATLMQGGLPYSNQTGLAHLALGRAWQKQGDAAKARAALQAAVWQLSHTVDANHPKLIQARQLL